MTRAAKQGLFLNYERLGLAPRPLQHNDMVRSWPGDVALPA